MPPPKKQHELKNISLAAVYCSCGWKFRLEELRGKTDEDLAAETYSAFEYHRADP